MRALFLVAPSQCNNLKYLSPSSAQLTHAHAHANTLTCADSLTHTPSYTFTCTHKRTSAKIVQNIKSRRVCSVTSLLCARLPLPNNTNIERELKDRFDISACQKEAQPHAVASARGPRVLREATRDENGAH